MPRIQVYLPEELYAEVKAHDLPASELLQEAARAELRRRELVKAGEDYLEELIAEVGEPSPEERTWARDVVDRLARNDG